jgi:predicted metalloprotease with PDZ domain
MTELSGQTIDYSIRIPDPKNHYANVSINYTSQEKGMVKISMPVWTPGSYLVREFAKNIETVTIEINGKSVNANKSDKNTNKRAHDNYKIKYVPSFIEVR